MTTRRRIGLWSLWMGALLVCGAVAPAALAAPTYPWVGDEAVPTVPLEQRFPAPEGFRRVEVAPGSFGAWLRQLPVRTDRSEALSYRGEPVWSPAAAILLLDVGTRDLQQCADTLIRLHAEYLWSLGKADRVAYHFTSGDRSAWRDWRRGERFRVKGSRVKRVRTGKRRGDHAEFRRYLDHVFRYAGTRSMARDSAPVTALGDIQPGDFFVAPGSPGHAVMALDVVVHEDGRRAALIGEGWMPAQDAHVIEAMREPAYEGVWFPLREGETVLRIPTWPGYGMSEVRRFR